MQDLTSTVRDYIFDNTDVELEEVYQVYQSSGTRIIAEVRVLSGGEPLDGLAVISPFRTKVTLTENARKEFMELVKEANQIR
jgi:hypothetical protein